MTTKAELVQTIREALAECISLMDKIDTLDPDSVTYEDTQKERIAAIERGAEAIVALTDGAVNLWNARRMMRGHIDRSVLDALLAGVPKQ